MKIKNIPLSQLVPSPDNVRKTDRMNGIAGLDANIEAKGLLQNLQVRPAANGTFEVVAGGRRLAALKLLAKKKALAKDAPVACNVLAKGRGRTARRARSRHRRPFRTHLRMERPAEGEGRGHYRHRA
jgi:ParB-like chromosome segregation protein Spo0J